MKRAVPTAIIACRPAVEAIGHATIRSISRLKPLEFEREEAGPKVEIQVSRFGVRHEDTRQAK